MFAPLGFSTFDEVAGHVYTAAEAKWPMNRNMVRCLEDGSIDWNGDHITLHMLYSTWLMNRVVSNCEAYLASRDGQIFRAGSTFFSASQWQEKFDDSLAYQEPVTASFLSYQHLYDTFTYAIHPQFRYIDTGTGIIRMMEEPPGLADALNKKTGEEKTHVSQLYPDDTWTEFELVQPFFGWSVCFREGSIAAKLEGHLNDTSAETIGRMKRPRGGRPPMAAKAARAYRLKYPKGHAPKTWQEVADEFGVSSKTIRNGLKLIEGAKSEKSGNELGSG
ncbi:hypothetical protein [Vannielia sp. SX4]|uniref:hypothetical protein n=1 Tax=Vannielia sp. SX4 TaxID=3463852 RepID=UPI004058397B